MIGRCFGGITDGAGVVQHCTQPVGLALGSTVIVRVYPNVLLIRRWYCHECFEPTRAGGRWNNARPELRLRRRPFDDKTMFSFRFRFTFLLLSALCTTVLCCCSTLNGPIVPAYYERVKGACKTRVSGRLYTIVDAHVIVLSTLNTNR